MKKALLASISAVALGVLPADAQFALTRGTNIAGVSAQCPMGTGLGDGCGVSPGLFYAPVGVVGSPPQPATKPTAAQWQAHAATSGQVWASAHAQPWNLVGIDFGTGPNQTLASMTDIAGWVQGTNNCVYMSAADGYNGTTGLGWTGTASSSGTTLTVVTTATGTLAPGMQLIPGPASLAALTFITASLGGGQFTLSRSFTHATESITASNTFYGSSSAAASFQWQAGSPALVCAGAASTNFSITGWNFGPSAFQQGTPVGSHDCVNLLIQPDTSASYTPTISVNNNAFINGTTCAPLIGGTRYGQFSDQSTPILAKIVFWNNYIWGRNTDPCCIIPGNQGFPMAFAKMENTVDMQYNWAYQTGSGMAFNGFLTGNEASVSACTNGTTYSYPGYTYITSHNYMDNFGTLGGGGHYELFNMGGIQISCLVDRSYNTILIPSTMPNTTLGPFFGWGSSGQGVVELMHVDHNTVVTNTVGGAPLPIATQFYNWYTDGGTPNHLIITGNGSSCTTQCTGPTAGMGISGGTGNTYSSVLSLETVAGSLWRAGCNQTDNAAGLCPNAGNYPDLAPGVAIGSAGSPVLNSQFATNTTSNALVSSDHGQLGYSTGFAAGAGGPFTGTTVLTTLAGCPAQSSIGTGAASGGYAGAILVDNTQANAIVGMITGTGCAGAPATFTLTGNAAISVASGDSLTMAAFGYGTVTYNNNYLDGSGALIYFSANPAVNSGGSATGYSSGTGGGGCAVPVTATGNIDLVAGGAITLSSKSGGC